MAEKTIVQKTLDFITPNKLLIGVAAIAVITGLCGIGPKSDFKTKSHDSGMPLVEKIEREPKCEGAAAVATELFTEKIAFTGMRPNIELCRREHFPELERYIARNDSVQFRRDNLKCLDDDPDLKSIIDYLKEARALTHHDAVTRLPSTVCEVRTDMDLARNRYSNEFVDAVEKLTNRVYRDIERPVCTEHSMHLVDLLASAVATSNETMLRQFMDGVDSFVTEKSRLEMRKCLEDDRSLAQMLEIFKSITNKDDNLLSSVLIKGFARTAFEARAGQIKIEQDYGPEFVDAARKVVTRIKIEELHCDKEAKELFGVYLEALRQSKVTPLLTRYVDSYNENAGSESFRKRFELCFAEDHDLRLMKLEFKRIISVPPDRFYRAMAFAFFAANTKPDDASKTYGAVFVEQARKVMAKLKRTSSLREKSETGTGEDLERDTKEIDKIRERLESEGTNSWISGIVLALGGIGIGIAYYLITRRRDAENDERARDAERTENAEHAEEAERAEDTGHEDGFDGDDDPGRDRRN